MRPVAAGALAMAMLLAPGGVATAQAGPSLRITSFRVLKADGRTPAKQPLARGVKYVYRLDYRIGGRRVVRLRRAGTVWSPYRDKLVLIRPRAQTADPGRYYASDSVRVPRGDSPGEYRITYAITARDRTGSTTRRSTLRMRFR